MKTVDATDMFAAATNPAVEHLAERTSVTKPRKPRGKPKEVVSEPWTSRWLVSRAGWGETLLRIAGSLGLAALFGLAMGARSGGASLATHALGVPAGMATVLLVGVPALAIVLAFFDAPIDTRELVRCAGRGAAAAGMTLAGLAPATALFVVTSASHFTAVMMVVLGLAAGALLGVRHFYEAFAQTLEQTPLAQAVVLRATLAGFVLFSGLLATRVWMATLSILGGGP
jgi:hypothetical protein